MCLTTLIVILLAIVLLLRPSNCFWACCEAPAVLEGATAKLTFYTNGSMNELNSSSLEVLFIKPSGESRIILTWSTSNQNFSINGNYHYDNNLPDHLELCIPDVMHNSSGEYILTDVNIRAHSCTLTVKNEFVLASYTSNENCLINDKFHYGNNFTGHPEHFISNVTHNNADFGASATQTPSTTISVVIAVLVTFGVTLAVITVVLYISYKYRCLFFKHRVTTQHTSEHMENGRPLMSPAVNSDHVPY